VAATDTDPVSYQTKCSDYNDNDFKLIILDTERHSRNIIFSDRLPWFDKKNCQNLWFWNYHFY